MGFFLQLVPLPGLTARPKRLLQKLEGSYHSLPNPSIEGDGKDWEKGVRAGRRAWPCLWQEHEVNFRKT